MNWKLRLYIISDLVFNGEVAGGFGGIGQEEYPDDGSLANEATFGSIKPTTEFSVYQVVGHTTRKPDYTLLHIPSTKSPRGPNTDSLQGHPTSSSVTSNKPKGRDQTYLYVLYALIAIIALVAIAALIFYCYKHQQPTKGNIESGVASGDHQPASSAQGSYAAKK